MIGFDRTLGDWRRMGGAPLSAVLLTLMAGCSRVDGPATSPSSPTLTVGYGLATGSTAQAGIQQTIRNFAIESLVAFGEDGRPQARLAERWSVSPDGLTLRIHLRHGVTFHNGQPLTASVVRAILLQQLPGQLGPAYGDVEDIRAVSDMTVEFSLRRRSSFLFEALDVPIEQPGPVPIGTGPFHPITARDDRVELRANDTYYLGKPLIDRVVIRSYGSVRSAWADMLRGEVDMLYEVGFDALDSLQPSTNVQLFVHQRQYAYVLLLNVRRQHLASKDIRRQLNAAIDRRTLVSDVLNGHGTPATGPVWPGHWAYSKALPKFEYQPASATLPNGNRLLCLFADSSLERLGLMLQKQLLAVGVHLELRLTSVDEIYEKVTSGDFDVVLADANSGPTLIRSYRFWHSGGPFNWGGFTSSAVDQALAVIRDAPDDDTYRAGVAAFQRAIIDDPPAIFLVWSERARAVSTRFEVPDAGAGRDILPTLRLWRPATDKKRVSPN